MKVSLICLVLLISIGVNSWGVDSKKKISLEERLDKIQKSIDWLSSQHYKQQTAVYRYETCHADCEKSLPWPNWSELKRPKGISDEDWEQDPKNRDFESRTKLASECHERCQKIAPLGYQGGGC